MIVSSPYLSNSAVPIKFSNGRDEARGEGWAKDGVIFTESAGHLDEIAVLQRTDGQAVA